MARSTILFGNGLGMALDPDYFSLTSGMNYAWHGKEENPLSEQDKTRICQCLESNDISEPPKDESQLALLHQVISACDTLHLLEKDDISWLSPDARPFPFAVRAYITRVAMYYHFSSRSLPNEFLEGLFEYIRETKAHVATLNYDNLLYLPFISAGFCAGYDGYLVDGFHNAGFAREHLERRYDHDFGWYLHLHGSPLFFEEENGVIKKHSEISAVIEKLRGNYADRRHVVLTHFKYKPEVIISSNLLSIYWEFFGEALLESESLVIFGYSGTDIHINRMIGAWAADRKGKVIVVEWINEGNQQERKNYWKRKLDINNLALHQLESILDFDWKLAMNVGT